MVEPLTGGGGITRAPLVRGIALFGLPLVAAMLLTALFNLVDLFIVARYGDAAVSVAAVTIPSLVNSIPMIIFNGIVNAMIALVARHHGLGERAQASLATEQGILLTVVLGVVFGVPPYLYAEQICIALGATGAVIPPATAYLEIMSLGTVTMFMLLTVTGAMRAAGNSLLPMALIVGANILNVVLDVWFVFGGLGLEPMGVAGAAWATVASRLLAAVIGIIALYRGFAGLLVRRFVFHGVVAWRILRIGLPSCAQWLVRMGAYLYILAFLADAAPRAGIETTAAQAAFGVGLRLDSLALFGGFGWGAAAATFVGQNLGRGLPDRAVRATWIALGFNMMMMLLFAGGYILFAEPLLRAFGFDVGAAADVQTVIEVGRTYLYVSSAGYVFLAVAVVISQALAGAGATIAPFVIEVVAYGIIGYPLTRWVAQQTDVFGLRGFWIVAVALHLAVAVVYMLWFRYGPWTKKELH